MPKPTDRHSATVARRVFKHPESVDPNDALTLASAHLDALRSLQMFRTLIITLLVAVVVMAAALGVVMAAAVGK